VNSALATSRTALKIGGAQARPGGAPPPTAHSLRHTYICLCLLEGADIHQIAKNCRTSVEMIKKYYAAHIKTNLDAAAINIMRPKKRSRRRRPPHTLTTTTTTMRISDGCISSPSALPCCAGQRRDTMFPPRRVPEGIEPSHSSVACTGRPASKAVPDGISPEPKPFTELRPAHATQRNTPPTRIQFP